MAKLTCDCGSIKFYRANYVLTSNPPQDVYICTQCGTRHLVQRPIIAEGPIEVELPEYIDVPLVKGDHTATQSLTVSRKDITKQFSPKYKDDEK